MRVNRDSNTRKALGFKGFRVTGAKWPFAKALANFLSWDTKAVRDKLRKDTVKDFGSLRLSEALKGRYISADTLELVLKHMTAVQDELRTDVLKVLEGGSAELTLREIVKKIEAMGLTSFLGVWRWESTTRKTLADQWPICSISPPFEIKGERLFLFEVPRTNSLREEVYWLLYQSLEAGEFSRLRKCPRCPKIFVPEDPKRKFCSTRCKDTYNNERRRNEDPGYFARQKKNRKQGALKKAKRLLEKGKPSHFVQEETGLSRRALERAGLL